MFGLAVGLRAQGPALIRYAGPAGPGGRSGHQSLPFDHFPMRKHDFIGSKKENMMKYIYALFLTFAFCTSCKAQNKTELPKDDIRSKTKDVIATDSTEITKNIDDWNNRWKIKDCKLATTDSETASQGVIIQNSLPKGDRHTDSSGKAFGIAIFWTRVINETASPLELSINFPADSFAISPSANAYLQVFLPSDTMTLDKQWLYNYGVTGLQSFLDTGLNKPTMLRRIINSKEEFIFYTGVLLDQAGSVGAVFGPTRAGFVLKEEGLFYRINLLDPVLIPCGQIVFRN